MSEFIFRVAVHLGCFIASMLALSALDFQRFIKRGKVWQAQLLYLLLALSMAYLSAQFLISLTYKNFLG